MTLRRFAVLAATTAVLTLSACANGTTSSPSAPAAPPPSAAVTGEQSVPSAPTSALPTSRIPVEKGAQTITGTVAAGVESGCLVLTGADTQHVLIFDDPALRAQARAGATITVTGRADPTQMTTCQQGVPFIVTAVRTP